MREPMDWPSRDPLAHRADTTPERTALIDAESGAERSYRDLDAAVDTVAAAMDRRLGESGGRVATLVDTRPAVGRLLFGAWRSARTLAPLNPHLDADALAAQLSALETDLLVCEAATGSLAVAAADCPVVSVDAPATGAVEPLAAEDIDGHEPVEPEPLPRDHTAVVLFTSGTTGDPKGVRLTLGNLVASATASAFRLGVLPGDRWLVCLPTYHMGGLAPFVRSVCYGTAVVVQRTFDPAATARVLAGHDVTGVSLVPTMLSRLLESGWEPAESLRFVLLGGGPASTDLIERCEQRGVPVCPTYGMTETASQVATARPETAFAYPDTVGQPLVCTDVTVLADGEPAEPGQRGELVVAGPTVTPGYLDGANGAFSEWGFHTGDLGYRDDDGRLWVVGRVDDRIVTGGENVHTTAVADTIRACPGVDDAAVVGLPDEEWGQRVAALVVGDVTEATVLAHCRAELAPYEVPKTVRVVTELPRTPSGTVDRDAVRQRLQS